MIIAIYIEDPVDENSYMKLDLFDDEKIEITQKLTDVDKLSNVFTDYTQSFTVPATPKNNKVFKHFYDADVDGTFNANVRIEGFIEIDTIPFKFGKFQLEKVQMKKGFGIPDNYKISFYGNTVQISDLFGDAELASLTDRGTGYTGPSRLLDKYDYNNSPDNFGNLLGGGSGPSAGPNFLNNDLIMPLIAYTDRDWNIGTANSTDISLTAPGSSAGATATAVKLSEVRPAIRVLSVIEAIEEKYDIEFSRDFFGQARFANLYMWLNENEDGAISDFVTYNLYQGFTGPNDGRFSTDTLPGATGPNVMVLNTLSTFIPFIGGRRNQGISYRVTPSNPSLPYDVRIEDKFGNVLKEWFFCKGQDNYSIRFQCKASDTLVDVEKTTVLKIRTSATQSFTVNASAYIYQGSLPLPSYDVNVASNNNVQQIDSFFLVHRNIQKMKIIDFFQGLMKMFKLVIRPTSLTSFYIDTLDNYYNKGKLLNLSDYVDVQDFEVERPQIYKTVNFKFEKTNNVAGKFFREANNPITQEGYGDEIATFNIDTKETLKVEVPFENMLFERLRGVDQEEPLNITIGQSISVSNNLVSLSKNKSKGILFYNNGIVSHPETPIFFWYDGLAGNAAGYRFSYNIGNTNDIFIDQVTDSINFGVEEDPWHEEKIFSNLYSNYWSNWIETIYDLKQRKYSFNAYLPPRYVKELSVNDRIIIGDTRYKINDFKIDLTTGNTKLNLFRDIYDIEITDSIQFTNPTLAPSGYYLTSYSDTTNSVYLYGSFTTYNGESANRIIKLKANGERDTTFNMGTGLNSNPFAFSSLLLYPDESKLLVTGFFTQYNGTTQNRITRLLSNGTIDSSFSIGTGFNNYTCKASLDSSQKIYVCGAFTSYNGTSLNRFVKLNADGTRDTSFVLGTGFNSITIDSLVYPDDSVLVTGYFSTYKGATANRIVKLLPNGNVDTSFNSSASFNTGGSQPNGILDVGDGLVFYGYFTQYAGVTSNRIVKTDYNGNILKTETVGFDGPVAITKIINGNKILLGGTFTSYRGVPSNGKIILNPDLSILKTFNDSSGNVFTIGNSIYSNSAGGAITLLSDGAVQVVSRSTISAPASPKYFDIDLYQLVDYTVSKVDTGYGTGWIDITNQTDSTITFRVANGTTDITPATGTPNARTMIIRITYEAGTEDVLVTQEGIVIP